MTHEEAIAMQARVNGFAQNISKYTQKPDAEKWTGDELETFRNGTETPLQRMQAKGRLPAGKMNNSEKEYSKHLENRKQAGEILWWAFEPFNIRLAPNTYYRCDFGVLLANGQFECHEFKGHWTDDARVKIKVAAELLPFQFIAIQKLKGVYVYESF
jgi:hypothetical protein